MISKQKMAQKKAKFTDQELDALIPERQRVLADTRTKEQLIKAVHSDRRKMKTRAGLGTAASTLGMGATLASIFPKSPALQRLLVGKGLVASLGGAALISSARKKARDLSVSKRALLRKIDAEPDLKKSIKKEHGQAKTAAPADQTDSVDFSSGLRIASDTLYTTFMDKTASNPMLLARLGKLISGAATKASPHAAKAYQVTKSGGKALAEGIESGARMGRDKLMMTFPKQGEQFAALLKRNPELAKTLGAAKENWRPLAGGFAAGGLLMSGD